MLVKDFLEILERSRNGPVCKPIDWDAKIVPQKAEEKLKEHDLRGTYDVSHPINCDDSLADDYFRAAFELAADLGYYCTDTERVVRISEQELRDSLRDAPSALIIGSGFDQTVLETRRPEDGKVPKFCAPLGIVVSEDLWVPLMQGVAEQRREVDMIQGASLITVYGHEVTSGTPFETIAGKIHAQMHREAMWRAGRPGIPTTAIISSVTFLAQLGGFGIEGGFDAKTNLAMVLSPAELKTSYASLNKVAHAINCSGRIYSGSPSIIGGFAGGVEATTIVNIAGNILNIPIHKASVAGGGLYDIRYHGNCGPEGCWAMSVKAQALSRNTHILTSDIANQTAGPCTEMLLYESAVGVMSLAVSGVSMSIGPRSANGRYKDHLTPLECKFCGEVLHAAGGMRRTDANEIAKKLIPLYEKNLRMRPKGKSFPECYDTGTLKPSEEWMEIYRKVRGEIVELGVPLE